MSSRKALPDLVAVETDEIVQPVAVGWGTTTRKLALPAVASTVMRRQSRSAHLRGVFSAIWLGGLALVLAACNNLYQYGDFALGYKDDRLAVVTCVDRVVTDIRVDEWIRGDGDASDRTIWHATGNRSLRAGESLVVGGHNAGLETQVDEPLAKVPGMKYYIDTEGSEGIITSALFEIPDGSIPEGLWLSPEGYVTDEPCISGDEEAKRARARKGR